jgi:hypothetical protein
VVILENGFDHEFDALLAIWIFVTVQEMMNVLFLFLTQRTKFQMRVFDGRSLVQSVSEGHLVVYELQMYGLVI